MSPAGTDLPRFDALTVTGNTREELERVAQHVRDAAKDADDERDLLETLGLITAPPHPQTGKKKRATPPAATTTDIPINTTTGATS